MNVLTFIIWHIQPRNVPRWLHNSAVHNGEQHSDCSLLSLVSKLSSHCQDVVPKRYSLPECLWSRFYDKLDFDAYCTSTRTTSVSIDCVFTTTVGQQKETCSPGLVGPGHVVQFAIQVAFASSDLSKFPAGYIPGFLGGNGAFSAAAFTPHVPGAVVGS